MATTIETLQARIAERLLQRRALLTSLEAPSIRDRLLRNARQAARNAIANYRRVRDSGNPEALREALARNERETRALYRALARCKLQARLATIQRALAQVDES
jgi:hypothetical protein